MVPEETVTSICLEEETADSSMDKTNKIGNTLHDFIKAFCLVICHISVLEFL